MASRLELQSKFEELLGSRNVYYQAPESIKMQYPAIRYKKVKPAGVYANNKMYRKTNCYEVTVIDPRPDNPVIDKLLELPMCSFDRNYRSDNLNHDVLTLYY